MNDERCPNCGYGRWWGCRFGCPTKQPPTGLEARPYESWAAEQREQHATHHEACGRTWKSHTCPEVKL